MCIEYLFVRVTCGGKSTLAEKLKNSLEQHCPCKVIGVDDYYKVSLFFY